jgi:type IV pilus assembly protein PilE
MSDKKGFTLMELIVVMIIIGILATVAVSNYTTMMIQGAAKAAQNNLTAIYNAQKNYYFNNNKYCISPNGVCNSSASVNTTLSLNISDNNFTYTCNDNASGFVCYATNNSDANLYLTITNNPIILPGGSTCASSTGANPGCNPSCSSDVTAYCPS